MGHITDIARSTAALAITAGLLFVGAGCAQDEETPGASPATSENARNMNGDSGAAQASVPSSLFIPDSPEEIVSLSEAKTTASVGDRVAFEGRIGGKVEPFTEGSAMFLVADMKLAVCGDDHGCPTPWDYCCEPKDSLLANLATIQVVGEDGRPLPGTLKGVSGLDPQKRIVVVGTVRASDGPTFVVDASQIFVDRG